MVPEIRYEYSEAVAEKISTDLVDAWRAGIEAGCAKDGEYGAVLAAVRESVHAWRNTDSGKAGH